MSRLSQMQAPVAADRAWLPSGIVLGVAFSGFFDGILLHQILQWHHLLSLVPGPAFRDPRVQIAADGAFHALMYLLAMIGLAMLWGDARGQRSRGSFWRSFALGFGAWNMVDVALFHWILEWHHIRLDTGAPLLWDIGWLLVFGVAPIAIFMATRHRDQPMNGRILLIVTAVILAAGAWAARAPREATTLVLFAPNTTPNDVMAAVVAVDGRLIAIDASGTLAVVDLPSGAGAWRLYGSGALLVSSAGPAGCAAWSTRLAGSDGGNRFQ